MASILTRILEDVLLPPAVLYIGFLLGALALWRARKSARRGTVGIALMLGSGLSLALLSTPWVAYKLLDSLQTARAIPPGEIQLNAGAIVVLAGDVDCDPAEYGQDQPGALSLQRCRYGAHLARRTGLPLLIAGGVLRPDRRAVSRVLAEFIEEELGVDVRWTEEQSLNTRQNAERSAAILRREGVERVALVTHAWHMPRALACFEATGLEVIPAPTGAAPGPSTLWQAIRPRMRAFRDSGWAIHEYVGRIWYAWTGA